MSPKFSIYLLPFTELSYICLEEQKGSSFWSGFITFTYKHISYYFGITQLQDSTVRIELHLPIERCYCRENATNKYWGFLTIYLVVKYKTLYTVPIHSPSAPESLWSDNQEKFTLNSWLYLAQVKDRKSDINDLSDFQGLRRR